MLVVPGTLGSLSWTIFFSNLPVKYNPEIAGCEQCQYYFRKARNIPNIEFCHSVPLITIFFMKIPPTHIFTRQTIFSFIVRHGILV